MTPQTETVVRKSISVHAGVERAFQAFTTGMDGWWPREHHIGKVPMRRSVLEGQVGGRCYTEHTDDSECDWGRVLIWEPPQRFVMAWLINANWEHEPDLSRASEVEVRFTEQSDGTTRVDLEHRNFERMGQAGNNMRIMIDSPSGWGGLLRLYVDYVKKGEGQ